MDFLSPYIKSSTSTTGNIPSPPTTENIHSPSADYSTDETYVIENDSIVEPFETTQTQTASEQNITRKKKTSKPLTEVDKAFIHYFKRPNPDTTDDNNARKHFLMSILPDVEELDNTQFRVFRRRVLSLLDEINSDPSYPAPPTTSCTSSIPFSSPSPTISDQSSGSLSQTLPPIPQPLSQNFPENSGVYYHL